MSKNFLANLRNKPYKFKVAVALITTAAAAIVLVPLWIWNSRNIGLGSTGGGQEQKEQEDGISFEFPNPLEQIDEGLKDVFAKPINITSIETVGENLKIVFRIENSTFANLIFPFSQANLTQSGLGQSADGTKLEKATTVDGRQFVPLVQPGQTLDGVLYFPKMFNGEYVLKFPNLRYEGDDQSEFEQIIYIEVKDAYLPRT